MIQVLITVPLRALLDQFAPNFPGFCKVGMGHNKKIDFDAKGFIAVTDSTHLLKHLKFDSIFVDEAHHPLPAKMPSWTELYQFSATHKDEPDFRYTMGRAIEDGVLCDYDITVPALTAHHVYVCLADLLQQQAGRFRRVLAYCNSIVEARRFGTVLRELGLAAWHINAKTPPKKRSAVIQEFAGTLLQPVHVLVTVEVLGEGINIPNADTCMFVEPRSSYISIIQALGRVLRRHPAKTLAHIVLPAVAIHTSRPVSPSFCKNKAIKVGMQLKARADVPISSRTEKESKVGHHGNSNRQSCRTSAAKCSMISKTVRETKPTADANVVGQHSSKLPVNRRQIREENQLEERMVGPIGGFKKPTKLGQGVLTASPCLEQLKQEAGDGPVAVVASQQTLQQQALAADFPRVIDEDVNGEVFAKQDAEGQNEELFGATRRGPLRLETGSGSLSFNHEFRQFGGQLDRFLVTLMAADHRLIGAAAGHRIQVADCTLANSGAVFIKGALSEIHSQLSKILFQEDEWEIRLQNLEAFADKNSRLPSSAAEDDYEERSLGVWLSNQGLQLKAQRLPMQRLQKLLASSPLIRQRAEGWQTGDTDGRFGEKCQALRGYLHLHHKFPKRGSQWDASSRTLAVWLANLRRNIGILSLERKNMLQDVHPLVKAKLENWQESPRTLNITRWEKRFDELSRFVWRMRRLPSGRADSRVERGCHSWLQVERKRFLAGQLPEELLQRFRNSHPLLSAFIDATVRRHAQEAEGCKTKTRIVSGRWYPA